VRRFQIGPKSWGLLERLTEVEKAIQVMGRSKIYGFLNNSHEGTRDDDGRRVVRDALLSCRKDLREEIARRMQRHPQDGGR